MTTEAYDALSQIAATDIRSVHYRGSLALIGFSEQTKPSFAKHILEKYFSRFGPLLRSRELFSHHRPEK